MAPNQKKTDYEKEMDRLRMLFYTVETSDEEIDCALTLHSLFGSGRNITMDNWYTSYPLAKELLSKKLAINLKKNKAVISVAFSEIKQREVFSSMFGFQKDITLVPKKSKCVIFLSTMHHDAAVDENSEQKMPEVIQIYNGTKGGVNSIDKMSALR